MATVNKALLKKLGKHIQQLRLEKGLTQAELANAVGKDQQSVQRLEAGGVNPSFQYLYEIAKGLKVPISIVVNFLPEK